MWWGPGDYLLRGLEDPQKFFYRGAIMDSWERAGTTFSYIDPKNLAGWIERPILMGVGLQDTAAPAPAAYIQVRGPKEYRVYPEAGHGTPPEHDVVKMGWIREQFGIGTNR